MQYKLITTRKGQIPIEEVTEGMEIYSLGLWVRSPQPIKAECIKCTFDTLPTTIFEKKFVTNDCVAVNHVPFLGKTTEYRDELAIRGYFKEDFNARCQSIPFSGYESMTYWYPKFIRLFGETGIITMNDKGLTLYVKRNKLKELDKEDLTERNLEYYLEGMTRKFFFFSNNKYHLKKTLSESDKVVLQLLGIDTKSAVNDTLVRNPLYLLKHIKDDFTKNKIEDWQIAYVLKKNINYPEYTNGYEILKKEECIDWILPGINPDINAINPQRCFFI